MAVGSAELDVQHNLLHDDVLSKSAKWFHNHSAESQWEGYG